MKKTGTIQDTEGHKPACSRKAPIWGEWAKKTKKGLGASREQQKQKEKRRRLNQMKLGNEKIGGLWIEDAGGFGPAPEGGTVTSTTGDKRGKGGKNRQERSNVGQNRQMKSDCGCELWDWGTPGWTGVGTSHGDEGSGSRVPG